VPLELFCLVSERRLSVTVTFLFEGTIFLR
jgi:hypothetical protein